MVLFLLVQYTMEGQFGLKDLYRKILARLGVKINVFVV